MYKKAAVKLFQTRNKLMDIKLDQYEVQQAIAEYLSNHYGMKIDKTYTETFVRHVVTHTEGKNRKKLKQEKEHKFFWYSDGESYNDERIEFEIFVIRED